jgi:TM2 domain-containing membrane protein YozV
MSSSAGNFIAALASFFIPGLGQLIQGRIIAALAFFVISVGLWFIFLGWLGHIVACLEAAFWRRRSV